MYVDLEEAALLLSRSQPVAIPTETVWGLAAMLADEKGVEAIFRLKNRPPKNPLIIHIHDPNVIKEYASFVPNEAASLMQRFWPGGLTITLPILQGKVPACVRADLPTAAFRMPNHPTTLELIKRAGPLVAPSANISGKPSATTSKHIEEDFGTFFPVLYSSIQPCSAGIESTILIWKDGVWYLGRPGAVGLPDIKNILGYTPSPLNPQNETPLCPGQLYRHYAPKAQLYVENTGWRKELAPSFDGVLGFTDRLYVDAAKIVTLGASTSVTSVSHRLYAALRELDELHLFNVFVDLDIPGTLEWLPIHDRLLKAAAIQPKND